MIILILGVGVCKSDVGEGPSLVKMLREFLCPQRKQENPENRLKKLMGTVIEASVISPQEKKIRDLVVKMLI